VVTAETLVRRNVNDLSAAHQKLASPGGTDNYSIRGVGTATLPRR
jgi:hypothetical protein